MPERRIVHGPRKRNRTNEYGLRLRRILEELSYAQGKRILIKDVARAIAIRTTRPFTHAKLKELLYYGQTFTADDIRQIADGLGIDVRELLYDPDQARKQTRSVTTRRKRPVRSVWDELDEIPTPDR